MSAMQRTRFKLLVHEADGQRYEDIFVKIMSYAEPGFKAVKPHGNLGDRGNDGWVSVDGRYYQCYAPEDLPGNTANAIEKMKNDFANLKEYWEKTSPVKEFFFVLNDKFRGAPPHIYTAVQELKETHRLSHAEVYVTSQLEAKLFSQREDVIEHLLGSLGESADPVYNHLLTQATKQLYLHYWMSISDNLIAGGIEGIVLDGFSEFTTLVFRTELPEADVGFEEALAELVKRIDALVQHFTDSKHASLTPDHKMWYHDKSWRKIWRSQEVFDSMHAESEAWRDDLYKIHCNLVHALNLFATEVRRRLLPGYLLGGKFVVHDSLGTYNQMIGYQYIPSSFYDVAEKD
ncbi:hypothetical protein [Pseudomonas syringae]|uniref:hypothetical protein n=1 Tax=Pseudomonas syringae TaxID=317 RepID=UPI001F3F48DB|nr:hypothetical protein [Pseudomonas syringae]MCF5721501.1 hypothetical protein [Pseudomonas syringae]